MKIFDAHTHISADQKHELEDLLETGGFAAAISTSSPEEASFAFELKRKHRNVYVTAGVHPWRADTVELADMLPFISQADAVGEIGLDSVWGSVNMEIQRRIFLEQLALAHSLCKPIVLHTKGCEAEIAEMVSDFEHPLLVHWYSAPDLYPGYLRENCFFTIAPDLRGPAQRNVAEKIPLERLMAESDGAGSLDWVRLGKPAVLPKGELRSGIADIPPALEKTVRAIAKIKGTEEKETAAALYDNAKRFYRHRSAIYRA
ncbi:MAG: TatD family hydrolase [Clostridiales Family XIII bacterium]|jgi:TatD DNase family protein|nr:TatD family hydrolase [Clostridiales Family XIII bacterium]